MAGWSKGRHRIYLNTTYTGGTEPRVLVIPPEQAIDRENAQKDGVAQSVWMTECVQAFSEALNAGNSDKRAFG